jgi:hypothetical protein
MAEHIGLRNYTDTATGLRVRLGEPVEVPAALVAGLAAAGAIAAPAKPADTSNSSRRRATNKDGA